MCVHIWSVCLFVYGSSLSFTLVDSLPLKPILFFNSETIIKTFNNYIYTIYKSKFHLKVSTDSGFGFTLAIIT